MPSNTKAITAKCATHHLAIDMQVQPVCHTVQSSIIELTLQCLTWVRTNASHLC
jgi:hypothetical protein